MALRAILPKDAKIPARSHAKEKWKNGLLAGRERAIICHRLDGSLWSSGTALLVTRTLFLDCLRDGN